ncbi:MAG: serine/threonine-protein phosphatase [Anaerolineae bacterium]|nr:serine/threonine-protein phosphatase [Anaerolineae bacterium]
MVDLLKSLEVFGLSDVGRKRKRNEDFFNYVIPSPNTPEESLGAFFVVADGIGGMGFGEEASSVAVKTLLASYYDPKNPDPEPMNRLQASMQIANNAVIAKAGELGRTLIGTTAAGVIIHPKEVVLFNVGDARVYRIRGNTIERISRDQSVLEEQLQAGLITEEEAAQGRNMNVTAFIGQPGGVEPIYRRVNAQADDIFLICSDGLWDLVKEAELVQIITKNSPESAIQQLIAMVLDRGAPDNTTGIIIRMTPFKKKSSIVPILVALALMIGIAIGVMAILSNNPATTAPSGSDSELIDVTEENTPVGVIIITDAVEITSQVTPIAELPTETTLDVVAAVDSTPDITPTVVDSIIETTAESTEIGQQFNNTLSSLNQLPTATITAEETPDTVAQIEETVTEEITDVAPTPTSTTTETPSTTPSPTQTPLPTATATVTPSPTVTESPTPTNTPSPTLTATEAPTNTPLPTETTTFTPTATRTALPSATLDTEAMTLVFPFTATARANLPPATQTALSVQETQVAVDAQNTQTQVAFYATETAVFTVTAGVQTLQAVQTRVGATATARAESTAEFTPSAEITAPVVENLMVVVTNDARLYKLPDSRSELLLPLLFGDELTVFGIHPNGAWFYVEIQDQIRGWVPRFPNNQLEAYVSGTLIENLPILDPENPTAPSDEVFGVHLVVTNEVAINVREYASFDERANVFAGLQPYSVARIDATNPSGIWLRVSFVTSNNRTTLGWVSATLLGEERITIIGDLDSVIKINPLPLPEPETTETPEASPEVTPAS